MNQGEPTPERILQTGWSYAQPLILEAAIRHRVFDVLDEGPKTLAEIQVATGASVRGLSAIVNALVGMEFLSKDAGQRFALTPESAAFLVSTKPGFHGGLIQHCSEQLIPRWLDLTEIVGTGKPVGRNQEEGRGAYFQQFVEGIFPLSYGAARKLAASVPLRGDRISVLDLGAGSGVWGIALAEQSPNVRVTAVDWPEVLPVTQRVARRFGVADRFRFLPGDIFTSDAGTGHDIVILGHLLHSEGEERCRALLRRSFDALAPGGTIVIAEFLVNEERTAPLGALIFAVNMLVNTDQGTTYTIGEINGWLLGEGFSDPRTLDAPGPAPLILATRP